MPQPPPWWVQQQYGGQAPTATGPESGGVPYSQIGATAPWATSSTGQGPIEGGMTPPDLPPISGSNQTTAPFGDQSSYPTATPYPDPITYGQYMGPHGQMNVNFQDPMSGQYAPPPADIYGPSTDTNNYSPAGDGGQYVYDENWNYLSYEAPVDSGGGGEVSDSTAGGSGYVYEDPFSSSAGGQRTAGDIANPPSSLGDFNLQSEDIPTAPGEEPPVLPAEDISWTQNPPGSGLLDPNDAASVGAKINPWAMSTNWGGFAQGVSDFFQNPGYSSPDYLRSIGYQPGQGTGSLWPDESGGRGGPLPGSEAGLGSFSGGQLPGYGYDIGGLHKPFTPQQYSNLPSQFQSPFTAGMQMPSYSQYLAAWNPPTSNAQPGDEQPGDTGFPTGLVHSGQHIAPR